MFVLSSAQVVLRFLAYGNQVYRATSLEEQLHWIVSINELVKMDPDLIDQVVAQGQLAASDQGQLAAKLWCEGQLAANKERHTV